MLAKSSGDAYRGRVCVCAFTGVSARVLRAPAFKKISLYSCRYKRSLFSPNKKMEILLYSYIDIRGHYFPLMKNGLSVHKRIFSPRNTLKADDYSFKENNILK